MSDPTRTHGPQPESPLDHADRRAALPPQEPVTAADATLSHAGEPPTATGPRAIDSNEPVPAPPGFEIIREVGSGGMGVVYEARQLRLNRRVALKVLRGGRGDAKDIIRFLTEAEAVAAVRHPHVVQVYEFGQDHGRPFMVLELLEGGTLGDQLKDGAKLEARAAAELVERLAGAVQAMHDLGIVHRDLKPSNVLFSDGAPKITDFGLAKRDGGSDLTKTQAVMGTPAYMSPEQAKGDTKFVGPPSDIYALGVILYESLTGKRPFESDDTWAVLQKVIHTEPESPRVHVPGIPLDLELIALKCLEKNPASRYPHAAALATDLQSFLAGKPVSVRPASRGKRFVKWARRNPAIAGFSAALLFVGILGFAGISWALLKAEARGKDLAKSNEDLNSTLGDLTVSRNALSDSMNDVKRAQADAEERGYLSDVALAHQLWKSNDLVGMRAALDRCPPARRKWEWHYLNGIARPEREVIPTESLPLGLAFSPDGKLLVYQSITGLLVVRDLATGTDRFRIAPGRPSPNLHATLAFHPTLPLLAFLSGGTVHTLDLVSGNWNELPKPVLLDNGEQIGQPIAVGYSPEGQLLVAHEVRDYGKRTRAIIIRDAVTTRPVGTIPALPEPKSVVVELIGGTFSPDAKQFAVSVIDSGIRVGREDGGHDTFTPFQPVTKVWEIASGKELATGEGGAGILGSVAFSPEGKSVAFGSGPQAMELLLRPTPIALTMATHEQDVLAVAFDRNGLLWSGGHEKLVVAADRNTKEERFVLRGCSYGILRLAVSPDGKEVAVATGDMTGSDGKIVRFDVSALAADTWRSPVPRHRPSLVVALSADGSRFAASDFNVGGQLDSRLAVRQTTGSELFAIDKPVLSFREAFRPAGGLAVIDEKGGLLNYDPAGKIVTRIKFPTNPNLQGSAPYLLDHAQDGRVIVAVSAERAVRSTTGFDIKLASWDVATAKPEISSTVSVPSIVPATDPRHSVFPTGIAVSSDSSRAAAVFAEMTVTNENPRVIIRGLLVVWDLKSGKELFRRTTQHPLHAATFDSRGQIVAAGGSSFGVVMGWDATTGESGLTLTGHTRPILSLAFGPDGRLATGSADRTVKLWDLASEREILTFDGFGREITHLTFTPGGKNLVAATGIDMFWALTLSEGLPTDWPPAEVRVFRAPK